MRTSGRDVHSARGRRSELQDRPIEAHLADRELGGVNADREPAGAGVDVVTAERLLAPPVEGAVAHRAPGGARE